jgi:hypothetical protein
MEELYASIAQRSPLIASPGCVVHKLIDAFVGSFVGFLFVVSASMTHESQELHSTA